MRYRGQQLPYDPQRKVRTTEHVIADLSYNFLEWKVLQRGHWLDSPRSDYGIGATMFHHNERGEVENGEVRFQLKAMRKLTTSRDGTWISLTRPWYLGRTTRVLTERSRAGQVGPLKRICCPRDRL